MAPLLILIRLSARHDAGDRHRAFLLDRVGELGRVVGNLAGEQRLVLRQRAAGQVEAERLLLVAQPLGFAPLGYAGSGVGSTTAAPRTASPGPARSPRGAAVPTRGSSSAAQSAAPPASPQPVEGARLDQTLEDLAVERALVHFGGQLGDAAEVADAAARGEDRLHRSLADPLHRAEAEADGVADDGERPVALVHDGGSTAMPISRHSCMYLATLSFDAISEVSIAAMKATG